MKDRKIQWHPGFVAAMNLEFEENRMDLVYEKEYNLNTKPLEIDLLVIKKEPEVVLVNEIGKLFRGHNIVEYKSPRDHLNIDTFYKAAAYACLYKAYGKTVDERKADDITVSLIREEKPEGTLSYFKEHGIAYINPYRGIYYVTDTVLFPTQIIVIKELNEEAHIWLKALSREMQKEQMRRLLEKIEKMNTKFDRELADSVLQVSVSANRQVVDELRGDENMCQALLEIMEPEIDKIKTETKIRMIIELGQEDGLSDAAIIERIEKKSGVSYEKAEAYLEEYGKQPV